MRTITVKQQKESFFHFFSDPKEPAEDDEEEEDEDRTDFRLDFDEDYDVAHSIRTSLLTAAVLWYTGENVEDFDDDDDFEYASAKIHIMVYFIC